MRLISSCDEGKKTRGQCDKSSRLSRALRELADLIGDKNFRARENELRMEQGDIRAGIRPAKNEEGRGEYPTRILERPRVAAASAMPN